MAKLRWGMIGGGEGSQIAGRQFGPCCGRHGSGCARGQFVGELGHGKFLKREPTHF